MVQIRGGTVGQPDLIQLRLRGGNLRPARNRADFHKPHRRVRIGVVSAGFGKEIDAGNPIPSGGAVDRARIGEIQFQLLFAGEVQRNFKTEVAAPLRLRVVRPERQRDHIVAFQCGFKPDPDRAAPRPIQLEAGQRKGGIAVHIAPEPHPDSPVELRRRFVRQPPFPAGKLLIGPEVLFGEVLFRHRPQKLRADRAELRHIQLELIRRGAAGESQCKQRREQS